MKRERYITRGIKMQVPIHTQILLWELQSILRKSRKEIDYLQVYELKIEREKGVSNQIIEHRSEMPNHKASYSIPYENPIKAKIFIIEDFYEDKIVETMLLAEEY